jgi:uncharacterized protein (TIGR00251 family)
MLRVAIRVRPGASNAGVGGTIAGRLQVRVNAPAVDGRATGAALRAVADAFGVRPAAVTLVSGPTTRDKLVQIQGDEVALQARLTALLGG